MEKPEKVFRVTLRIEVSCGSRGRGGPEPPLENNVVMCSLEILVLTPFENQLE